MRVLVVDDHALFREAVGGMLHRLQDGVTIIEAGTAAEALSLAEHYEELDLILLDNRLPGSSGVAAIPALQQTSPQTPIVVLSADCELNMVREAIDAGAAGYVPKVADSHTFLAALRLVLAGDIYVPPWLMTQTHAEVVANDDADRGLTPRQKQVLALMADGCSNKLIARSLGISEATVKLHVSAILRELGVRNRTEAVKVARRKGWLK